MQAAWRIDGYVVVANWRDLDHSLALTADGQALAPRGLQQLAGGAAAGALRDATSAPDGRRNAGTARLLREGDADARQDADQLVHMTGKLPDIGFPRDRPLFHVEGAVDLDLERLDAQPGPAACKRSP